MEPTMREPEIPASAPILNAGRRTCALYPRTWADKQGNARTSITLAEVEPARITHEKGQVIVKSWKRKYRGLNFGMETESEWVEFVEALNKAFARGLQRTIDAPANGKK